ncbi:hypothetical protein LuPra_00758 [Luteitalea pratensis]|uniref:Uncharacterized protein n=1 Tax=Luteitalea pratensis TaxID=1855912 RepID=A0A143PGD1_LUTPR|nr:hypothetical protein LuPra_00758 [Luteitalea pratensis]
MEDGGRRTEDGGRRTEAGGWRLEDGGPKDPREVVLVTYDADRRGLVAAQKAHPTNQ